MEKHKTAVFLDRDGTINEEVGYIRDLAQIKLIPRSAEAIRRLNERGIPVILVTNQSGPARGFYPETWVQTLNGHVNGLLQAEGAHMDALYYCPHLPEGIVPEYSGPCRCRKPEPGMLLDAAEQHGLDLANSYMIGDKSTDVEVGQNAGCRTVLLRSGFGERILAGEYQWQCTPTHVANDLMDAVTWLLEDLEQRAAAASHG